jgi:hypothetical protein
MVLAFWTFSCEVQLKLGAPVAELEKLERALLAMSTARWDVQSTQALKVIIET